MKAVTFNIKGIKCDAAGCGWRDMDIDFDSDKFLNAPRPECGANLFTPADYKTMMRMFRVSAVINMVFKPYIWMRKNKVKYISIPIKMNGSGSIKTGAGDSQ